MRDDHRQVQQSSLRANGSSRQFCRLVISNVLISVLFVLGCGKDRDSGETANSQTTPESRQTEKAGNALTKESVRKDDQQSVISAEALTKAFAAGDSAAKAYIGLKEVTVTGVVREVKKDTDTHITNVMLNGHGEDSSGKPFIVQCTLSKPDGADHVSAGQTAEIKGQCSLFIENRVMLVNSQVFRVTGQPSVPKNNLASNNDLDLSYVTKDSAVAFVFNPTRIAKSPVGVAMLKNEFFEMLVNATGIEPSDLEHVLIVASVSDGDGEPDVSLVARFKVATDIEKLIGQMAVDAEKANFQGTDYFVDGDETAYYPADDRTLVVANETMLPKLLAVGNKPSGALADRLRTIELDRDIVGVFVMEPVREMVGGLIRSLPDEVLPPQLASVKHMDEQLVSATISFDFSGATMLRADFEAKDDAAATSLQSLVKGGLQLVEPMLPMMKAVFEAGPGADAANKLEAVARDFMNKISVTQNGSTAVVQVPQVRGLADVVVYAMPVQASDEGPPPAEAASEWKQYKYNEAGLSIAFPAEPASAPLEDGIVFNKELVDGKTGTFYNVAVIQLEAEEIKDGVNAFMNLLASDLGDSLTSRKAVESGGHKGEDFQIEVDEEGIRVSTTIRCFVVGRKSYQATIACATSNKEKVGADRFLASMKLLVDPIPELRVWQDITGSYKIEAELAGIKDGKAQLKKRDGVITAVPFEKLSRDDQRFLRDQFPIQTNPQFATLFAPHEMARADDKRIRVDGNYYVKTQDGGLLSKDFSFEILVTISPDREENGGITLFGFGEASRDGPYHEPTGSAFLRIHSPDQGEGEVELSNGKNKLALGNIKQSGTHLIRILKTGESVTFQIDVDNDGSGSDDLENTIPDIKTFVPTLNEKNAHVFFGGGGTYANPKFKIGTPKVVDTTPAKPNVYVLGSRRRIPKFLAANPDVLVVKDGVIAKKKFVRTKQGDYIDRDFVYEILVRVDSTNESREKLHYIGIGEAQEDAARMPNSAFLQFRAADDTDGIVELFDGKKKRKIGNLKSNDVHLVRITKKGDTLTFEIDQNNDGPTDDDIEGEISNLAESVSTLHKKNSYLFFGGAGIYQQVQLTSGN